jgi:hypothetical protein
MDLHPSKKENVNKSNFNLKKFEKDSVHGAFYNFKTK